MTEGMGEELGRVLNRALEPARSPTMTNGMLYWGITSLAFGGVAIGSFLANDWRMFVASVMVCRYCWRKAWSYDD